jgi:hypothetical protein
MVKGKAFKANSSAYSLVFPHPFHLLFFRGGGQPALCRIRRTTRPVLISKSRHVASAQPAATIVSDGFTSSASTSAFSGGSNARTCL